jgi:hypothetical protein
MASERPQGKAPRVKRVAEDGSEVKATRGVLKPELISYFRTIHAELEKDSFADDEGWFQLLQITSCTFYALI